MQSTVVSVPEGFASLSWFLKVLVAITRHSRCTGIQEGSEKVQYTFSTAYYGEISRNVSIFTVFSNSNYDTTTTTTAKK